MRSDRFSAFGRGGRPNVLPMVYLLWWGIKLRYDSMLL